MRQRRRVKKKTAVEQPDTIIVGSGTSLLRYRLGPEIDRFKRVVRFNGCQAGFHRYAKYIGNRTGLLVCNSSLDSANLLSANKLLKCKHLLLCDPQESHRIRAQRMEGYLTARKIDVEVQSKRALMDSLGFVEEFWPTSGYLMILKTLREREQVYIHGFDMVDDLNWRGHSDGTGYHFYNPSNPTKYLYHRLDAEAQRIRSLIEDGRVVELRGS